MNNLNQVLTNFESAFISFRPFANALDEIEKLLEDYRDARLVSHIMIMGESGTGKTTLCNFLLQKYPPKHLPDRTCHPLLYVPIPAPATLAAVAESILEMLGDPEPEKGTVSRKTARIKKLVKACGVEMILFDEAQHIQDRGKEPTQYMVGDWFKRLTDDIKLPMVLLGLPRLLNLLRINEQLRRRFSHRLEMGLGQDKTVPIQTECLQLFTSLAACLPIPISTGQYRWSELGHRVYYATDGRVAYIKSLLMTALRLAIKDGRAEISPVELEEAFAVHIWSDGIGALNPFNDVFELRPLTAKGEPFEPSLHALASKGGERHVAA